MPVTQPIKDAVKSLWPWAEFAVPGLATFMPLDAVVGIIDSIEIGLKRKIRVNPRFYNVIEIAGVVREITEAALVRTPQERREAIYTLLAFLTDVEEGEEGMTLEEFMAYASVASLPGD
jgi:hypothetical protein